MPKVNGRYKKKPYIPNYNPWALRPGQVSREVVNAVRAAQTKTNVGSHNLRKAQ